MSSSHKGKKFSDEHKAKIGIANKVENCTPEKRKKLSEKAKHPVQQFDMQGKLIATYSSIKEAAAATGVHWTNISGCVCGTRKHAKRYVWKYAVIVSEQLES